MSAYYLHLIEGKNICKIIFSPEYIQDKTVKPLISCDIGKNKDEIEKDIIQLLKKKYDYKIESGTIYFEGNTSHIIMDVHEFMYKQQSKYNKDGIEICNFGKENITYITKHYISDIRTSDEAIQKYMMYKHFNPEHPENHNIKFIKNNYYMKCDDKWQMFTLNTIAEKIYRQCLKEIVYNFDSFNLDIPGFARILHENSEKRLYHDKKCIISDVKDLIKCIFYNGF